MQAPEPLPVMTEHNKLKYSSKTRSLIADFNGVIRKRFEEKYGNLSMENYQVTSDSAFSDIVSHYDRALKELGDWAELDTSTLEWSPETVAAGWSNNSQVFFVLAAKPQNDSDMMPVQTLSNM